MAQPEDLRSGTFTNGMDFATWGGGTKSLLYLPGGPGSSVPEGRLAQMSRRWFAPFVEAGYAVWYVTRRRDMPVGHTIEDMADDYAHVIHEKFGGRVDLVVGESYGGMIAQHLAARHGETFGDLAVVVAAVEVSDWGKEVDARLLSALRQHDTTGFGTTFGEYALPGQRSRWVRRLLGPRIGRSILSGKNYPPSDVWVELEAEIAFDARSALPQIQKPVLLIAGDRDRFFPWALVEETARLVPDCTLVRYVGHGHMKAAGSGQVGHDVLAFVDGRAR